MSGSQGDTCENGVCVCNSKAITGNKCDECIEGHYDFPNCDPCHCSDEGSLDFICNAKTGDCDCKENVTGRTCGKCVYGYYGFPNCTGKSFEFNVILNKNLNKNNIDNNLCIS